MGWVHEDPKHEGFLVALVPTKDARGWVELFAGHPDSDKDLEQKCLRSAASAAGAPSASTRRPAPATCPTSCSPPTTSKKKRASSGATMLNTRRSGRA